MNQLNLLRVKESYELYNRKFLKTGGLKWQILYVMEIFYIRTP